MARKLIIVMANTDPRNGEELGAPIFQATAAAAMEYEVDVICTATSGRLMKKGVAEKLFVKEGSPKSVTESSRSPYISALSHGRVSRRIGARRGAASYSGRRRS